MLVGYGHYDGVRFFLGHGWDPGFVDGNGKCAHFLFAFIVYMADRCLLGSSTAILQARRQIRCGRARSAPANDVLRQIMQASGECGEVSTVIHDSVLGINSTPVEEALGAEPFHINVLDDLGYAPLHWAVTRDDVGMVEILIQHGAMIDIKTAHTKQTPLHIAAVDESLLLVQLLLEHGADVNTRDRHGTTPLHQGFGCLENVSRLLRAGANPDAKDVLGRTTLFHIIERASALAADQLGDLIAELVHGGADIELADNTGNTCFMHAIHFDNPLMARQLCALGARTDVVDQYGQTVFHHAAYSATLDTLNFLCSLQLRGVDQGRSKDGELWVVIFRMRMVAGWYDGHYRPTYGDVFAFFALVVEVRRRNWQSGLFLETKAWAEHQLDDWLGWLWQRLHDDPELADDIWDHGVESSLWSMPMSMPWRIRMEAGEETDYDTSMLYSEASGDSALPLCEGLDEEESDEEENFFDALE